MENQKLSYISWTVLIASVLILIGWFITHSAKANLKTYSNEKAKIEFKYSNDWTNMLTDKGLDKLVQLKNPKAYILVNSLRISPMGIKSGQSAFNRLSFDNYEELENETIKIDEVEAIKLSFSYLENEIAMQGCEILIPVSETELTVLGFYAPLDNFEDYKSEIKDIVKSISIK